MLIKYLGWGKIEVYGKLLGALEQKRSSCQSNQKGLVNDFNSYIPHARAEAGIFPVEGSPTITLSRITMLSFYQHFYLRYYNKQWSDAQAAIHDLLQQEIPEQPPKPEKVQSSELLILNLM